MMISEDRHSLHQHKVLVDHADPALHSASGGGEADLLAAEENLALRRVVQAAQNIHQRAFACAVFPQKCQDLAFVQGQADVPVGGENAEFFRDMLHPEQALGHSVGLLSAAGAACAALGGWVSQRVRVISPAASLL